MMEDHVWDQFNSILNELANVIEDIVEKIIRMNKENKKSANASKPSSKNSKHFNSLQHPEQGSRSEGEKKSRSIQTAERKMLKKFYNINIEVKDRK
ncbi:hypothetical protein ACHAXS_002151 [Conticribra weissflogii]